MTMLKKAPFALGLLVGFSALNQGAHDLWCATLVYVALVLIFVIGISRETLINSKNSFYVDLWFSWSLLLILFFLSYQQAVNPSESLLEFWDWLAAALLFFISIHVFQKESAKIEFFKILVPVFWIQLLVCLIQWHNNPSRFEKPGTLINANILSAFLLFGFPVFIKQSLDTLKKGGKEFWYWVSGAVAGLGALALATSTAAWICLIGISPFILKKHLKRNQFSLLIIYLSCILGLVAVLLWHKFTRVQFLEPGRDSMLRLSWWASGFEMLKEHLSLGVGLGNFASAYPAYKVGAGESTIFAHSWVLTLLFETGIFGMLGFFIFVGFFIKALLRKKVALKKNQDVFVGLILAFSFSLISIGFEYLVNLMMLSLFMGMLVAPSVEKAFVVKRSSGFVVIALGLFAILYLVDPFLASQHQVAGDQLLQEGKQEAALKEFEQARKLNPKHWRPYQSLAMIYFDRYKKNREQQSINRALSFQEQAINLNRLNKTLYWEAARYFKMAGDEEASLRYLRKAKELNRRKNSEN